MPPFSRSALIALSFLIAATGRAGAAVRHEWSVLAGGAVGVETRTLQTVLRWGVHGEPTGDAWRRGRPALLLELTPLFIVRQTPQAHGAAFTILGRYTADGEGLRPMFTAGIGLLAADNAVPPGEFAFNFTPQGGAGLQYSRSRTAVSVEYRFQHISNNGITNPNRGLNTHLLLVGISRR